MKGYSGIEDVLYDLIHGDLAGSLGSEAVFIYPKVSIVHTGTRGMWTALPTYLFGLHVPSGRAQPSPPLRPREGCI